jgi:hypothetical protein
MIIRLHRTAKLVGIFLLGEAGWFALLHPLVPSTPTGFAIEFTAGIAVAAVMWGVVGAIWWLAGRESNSLVCRINAVVLALSVGVVIFATADLFRDTLGTNFRYFIFARH